jgi:hypothetical protein
VIDINILYFFVRLLPNYSDIISIGSETTTQETLLVIKQLGLAKLQDVDVQSNPFRSYGNNHLQPGSLRRLQSKLKNMFTGGQKRQNKTQRETESRAKCSTD